MTKFLNPSLSYGLSERLFDLLDRAYRGAAHVARTLKHRREAAMLAGFDDRMLADIGLNRSDLSDAYSEPLWRDPTAMLKVRARDRRINRPMLASPVLGAPSLVPDYVAVPALNRPARYTV